MNNRKGKLIFFYEWELSMKWKGMKTSKIIKKKTHTNDSFFVIHRINLVYKTNGDLLISRKRILSISPKHLILY